MAQSVSFSGTYPSIRFDEYGAANGGSTNWRGYFLNGTQSASQLYTLPTIPTANRGTANRNLLVIPAIGMDLGGYNEAGDFRFCIWTAGGSSNMYYSDRIRTGNDGTAVDVSRKSLDITNGSKDDVLDSPDLSCPPTLSGGTQYRWGFYNTSGYSVSFQQRVDSTQNVNRDSAGSVTSFDSSGSTDTDRAFIGRAYYVMLPSAPSGLSVTGGVRQVSVSWTASTSDGGDPDNLKYRVEIKPASTSSWVGSTLTDVTSTSTTFTGLANGTEYDVRVYAMNTASEWITYTSSSPYQTTYTDGNGTDFTLGDTSPIVSGSATTTPLPAFTSSVVPSVGIVGFPYAGLVSASNTTSFSILTSGFTVPGGATAGLPSGVTFSGGTFGGTPTASGTFVFKVRATGPAGNTDSSLYTVVISPNGPWVITNKTTTPVTKARADVKVRWNGSWVSGVMRVYDTSYVAPAGQAPYWRPLV